LHTCFARKNRLDTNMIEDKQIVNKILDGQTEDFEILVDRYYEAILRYTKRILNFHLQDAEDVTSQTF
jgi:DNA-directed RNA polymerase specialized sigma24 family protein